MLLLRISITGILIIVALLSLRDNFGHPGLFAAITAIGLAASWWQQKQNKPIPYLKMIINVLFVAITVRAILPFFMMKEADILSGLIKTWIYFLLLSTFTIYNKRDYYLIQVLSAGLIIFSCFDQNIPTIFLLISLLLFFAIWIAVLRIINLSKDSGEIRDSIHPKNWLTQETRGYLIYILVIFLLSRLIYSIMPHFNISMPFLNRILEQRYSTSFMDYSLPNKLAFYGHTRDTLPRRDFKMQPPKAPKEKKNLPELKVIESLDKKQDPTFWYSPDQYKDQMKMLDLEIQTRKEELGRIKKQMQKIAQENNARWITELLKKMARLEEMKEQLSQKASRLQKQKDMLQKKYVAAVQELRNASIKTLLDKEELAALNEGIAELAGALEDTDYSLESAKGALKVLDKEIDALKEEMKRESYKIKSGGAFRKKVRQSQDLEGMIEGLGDKKGTLEDGLEQSEERQEWIQQTDNIQTDQPKEKEANLISLFLRILIIFILLIMAFLIYCSFRFLSHYLKEKNEFKDAYLSGKFNRAIIVLFIFLTRVLNIFGYKFPVLIDPEEYAEKLNIQFNDLKTDSELITSLFLEARYSTHSMLKMNVERSLECYKNIVARLKRSGSFWQKLLLSLDFVFKL